jgi:hypothetical protein
MKYSNFLVVTFLVTGIFYSNAQEEKYIVLDKKTISKIRREPIRKEPKKKILVENDFVVKFDPTRMLIGDLGFSLERATGLYSSIEFELGPTFSNLYSGNHYYTLGNFSSYDEVSDIGVFGSAAFRFYPMNGAFNGFYVSPKLKYRALNTQFVDHSGSLPDQKGSSNQCSFVFHAGYQLWFTEQFSIDFYAGIGLGYKQVNEVQANYIYNEITQNYDYSWAKNKYNTTNVVCNLGVKVGIGGKVKK